MHLGGAVFYCHFIGLRPIVLLDTSTGLLSRDFNFSILLNIFITMTTIVLGIRAMLLVFILGSAFSINPKQVFTHHSDDSNEPPFPPLLRQCNGPICTLKM